MRTPVNFLRALEVRGNDAAIDMIFSIWENSVSHFASNCYMELAKVNIQPFYGRLYPFRQI